jgi:hypothetical protein
MVRFPVRYSAFTSAACREHSFSVEAVTVVDTPPRRICINQFPEDIFLGLGVFISTPIFGAAKRQRLFCLTWFELGKT